jgi:hypothetical protein
MVNHPRTNAYTSPPKVLTERTKCGGPAYDLIVIQALIKADALDLQPSTRECQQQILNFGWSVDHVAQCVAALLHDDYRDSEHCSLSTAKANKQINVTCDAYILPGYRVPCPKPKSMTQLYLKFGFNEQHQTLTLRLVSCHEG